MQTDKGGDVDRKIRRERNRLRGEKEELGTGRNRTRQNPPQKRNQDKIHIQELQHSTA